MEEKIYNLLKKLVQSQGIDIYVMNSESDLEVFDNGLRGQLYENYDYNIIIDQLLRCIKKETGLYIVTDVFDVKYMIMGATQFNGKKVFIKIGPYLDNDTLPSPQQVAEKNGLDLYHIKVLSEYYSAVPIQSGIEEFVTSFAEFILDEKFEIFNIKLEFQEKFAETKIEDEDDNDVIRKLIEERYAQEERILSHLAKGDERAVFEELRKMQKFHPEERVEDVSRNSKNYMLTMNVLFRKAVQNAKVHPMHIDRTSSYFARKIEHATKMSELNSMTPEMVKQYCMLVKNYSVEKYSDLIGQVVNYIDFHMKEPLGLGYLAEIFSVNASHLSSQFKKETGVTLTDYINQVRIEHSLSLLVTTKLPINEVAERVGIYDENYFSRRFKKQKGMTPREYRNMLNQ